MNVKILVADDDKQLGDLLVSFLTKFGYLVDLAENVTSALELLENNTYDIILTDKNMPDSEGNPASGMALLKYAKENLPTAEVIMIMAEMPVPMRFFLLWLMLTVGAVMIRSS